MTDEQFVKRLTEIDALGAAGDSQMQAFLKENGGRAARTRLIALAERGVTRAKRGTTKSAASFLPDNYPDAEARAVAIEKWNKARRPDLVDNIERQIDLFRSHYEDTKQVDWRARWRRWADNAPNFTRPPYGTPAAVLPMHQEATLEEWVGRLKMFYGLDPDVPVGTWGRWFGKPGEPNCKIPAEAFRVIKPLLPPLAQIQLPG